MLNESSNMQNCPSMQNNTNSPKERPFHQASDDQVKNFIKLKKDLLSVKDPYENERRKVILESIETKLATQGAHKARAAQNRARQFMPFAALKGYSDMLQQTEQSQTPK